MCSSALPKKKKKQQQQQQQKNHACNSSQRTTGSAHLDGLRAVVAERGQRQEQEAAVRHHRDARLRAAPASPAQSAAALATPFTAAGPSGIPETHLARKHAYRCTHHKQTVPATLQTTCAGCFCTQGSHSTCYTALAALFFLALYANTDTQFFFDHNNPDTQARTRMAAGIAAGRAGRSP